VTVGIIALKSLMKEVHYSLVEVHNFIQHRVVILHDLIRPRKYCSYCVTSSYREILVLWRKVISG